MRKTQLVVVGGGPGGYVAAFRAADLGMEVTLVDEEADPYHPPDIEVGEYPVNTPEDEHGGFKGDGKGW